MNFIPMHPREDELSAYLAARLSPPDRAKIATHLRSCVRCQETLRFLSQLNRALSERAPQAPPAILQRALSSRASGERRILPGPEELRAVPSSRSRLTVSAAAVFVALAGAVLLLRPRDVSAVSSRSELIIAPALAQRGDTIRVRYRPSPGTFTHENTLVLRARLRMRGDQMYSDGVPAARIRRVALLKPGANGDFVGSFVLPDSIDFIAMVVEDTAAHTVDDDGGRLWEVLTHGPDGRPSFEALEQRMNDMMGRSWEEGYATAKELTALYPDRYDSWSYRGFFERSLFGDRDADRLALANGRHADAIAEAVKHRTSVTSEEMGTIFYDKRARTLRSGATAADTAEFNYWLNRTRGEFPRHPQLAQYYASRFTREEWRRPEYVLDSIEHLYAAFAPINAQARAILADGIQLASRTTNDSLFNRWTGRWIGYTTRGDSALGMALALADRRSMRGSAIASIRGLLATPNDSLVGARGLRENREQYRRRLEDGRRKLLAALGRSLVAEGNSSGGIAALRSAAEGSWDLSLFKSIQDAYAAAHDDAGFQAMRIRRAVDPRTNPDTAAAIVAAGQARFGQQRWDSLAHAARNEMYALMLQRSASRGLHGDPSVTAGDGREHTFGSLTENGPAVVVFWSRHCGFALAALPEIERTAQRLTRDGKRFLLVLDEPPSADLKAFLARLNWTLPAYYDTRGELRASFMNFGTPTYFVIDERRRIRFDHVDDVAEVIAQLDAVRQEALVQ